MGVTRKMGDRKMGDRKILGTERFGDRKILGGIHIKLRKNHECLFPLVLMSED